MNKIKTSHKYSKRSRRSRRGRGGRRDEEEEEDDNKDTLDIVATQNIKILRTRARVTVKNLSEKNRIMQQTLKYLQRT